MFPLRFGITSVFATLMSMTRSLLNSAKYRQVPGQCMEAFIEYASINEDFFAIMPLDFDDGPSAEGAICIFHFRRSVGGAMEGVLRERDQKNKELETEPADFVQDLELFAEMAQLMREPCLQPAKLTHRGEHGRVDCA
jgi:hypothetical protein